MNSWMCALGVVVMGACSERSTQTVPSPPPSEPTPTAPSEPTPPRRATAEECDRACQHVSRLFLDSVSEKAAQDTTQNGVTVEMAKETAALFIDHLSHECRKSCEQRATVDHIDCLLAATTSEAISNCNGGPP